MKGCEFIETFYYYITLSSIKIIDNIISTEKTILTQKNKAFAASVLVAISQFIFLFLIAEVVTENNVGANLVVSIASGVGSYIAFFINNKFSKERVYINIITSNDREKMENFGDYMRTENIKVVTFQSYNDNIEKTLTALVFANTKEDSRKINKYVAKHDGLFREVV